MNSIILKSHELNNVAAVTLADIDAQIVEMINKSGDLVTLQTIAKRAASSSDFFYRTVLHVAANRGILSLSSKENGKYDGTHDAVKAILNTVSEDSGNSQRKYASDVMNKAWTVKQAGYEPFDAPSMSILRTMSRPVKVVDVTTDEGTINQSAIEAVKESAKQAEVAKAEALRVEAEKAEVMRAERQAAELKAKAEAARDKALSEVEAMRAALQTALYGTNDARKALRGTYPKA